MPGPDIFISSCSRRQMARRRGPRGAWSRVHAPLSVTLVQVLLALLVMAAAFGAFVAGRGGV